MKRTACDIAILFLKGSCKRNSLKKNLWYAGLRHSSMALTNKQGHWLWNVAINESQKELGNGEIELRYSERIWFIIGHGSNRSYGRYYLKVVASERRRR